MMSDVTEMLDGIDPQDPSAPELLLPLVYDELRKLAAARLQREAPGQTWQPTVLVHEAYLRLVDVEDPQRWDGRRHFFAAAAEAMRRILVESARRKATVKRGGNRQRVDFSQVQSVADAPHDTLLLIHDALHRFEERWPNKAQIVKLRFFTGLTIPEVAETLGISHATVERHWQFSRAWLFAQLTSD